MYLLLHDTSGNEMLIRVTTVRLVTLIGPVKTCVHTEFGDVTVGESVRDIAKMIGAYGLVNDEPEKV